MEQNYFQYNNQYYKPQKGVTMESPISGTIAEIYLQKTEEEYIKQWSDSQEISYYKRYVDDIIILCNQNLTNEIQILEAFNKADKNLQFKMTTEENKNYNS
jgi:hypothetical protein